MPGRRASAVDQALTFAPHAVSIGRCGQCLEFTTYARKMCAHSGAHPRLRAIDERGGPLLPLLSRGAGSIGAGRPKAGSLCGRVERCPSDHSESSDVRVRTQRKRDSQSGSGQRPALLRYAGMGVELGAAIIGLTLLGLWIDYRCQTGPIFLLVGAGLGIIGGFYNFIRQALRMSQELTARRHGNQTSESDDHIEHP